MILKPILSAGIGLFMAAASFAAWLPVESGNPVTEPQLSIRSLSSDTWQVDIQVPGVETDLQRVMLPGEPALESDDAPPLPVYSRFIALRSQGNPLVEIVSEEWIDLPGSESLSSEQFDTHALTADISPRQIMGGVSLALLRVFPVKQDPQAHTLRVLRHATLRLTESGASLPRPRAITETVANTLRPLVPNWDDMALDNLVERGTYLFIVADNGMVQSGIQNLATWRTRRGYKVEIAGPNEIANWSTSGIKAFIQSRYNGANPPLEFVCIAGDANGTYTVPCYTYGGGAGDWDYTRLDGTDLLPDIAIGRLCFASGAELAVITNKVLNYERDPVAIGGGTKPNWYAGAGLFAGGSGTSAVHTMRWVRERLLETGYPSSSIDTVYYTNESVDGSKITNSINSGVSIWCYRGYLGMNGFEGNDLSGLSNGRRLPFLLALTCGTNDFSTDDITERFVRVGNGGAVAAVGMSTSSTHTRFNNILMTGAMQGMLREGNRTTGGSLMRAKLELYRGYPTDSSNVAFFSGITTLIGEPAIDIFTGTPDTLHVNNPATAPVGTNHFDVSVTNRLGQPVADAWVNLVKGTEIFVAGRSDAAGSVSFNFSTTTAETLFVTATKHNCRPAISYTLITAGDPYVSLASQALIFDDDNNGNSSGNGDGKPNPGETIELPLRLRNWGPLTATGITATLTVNDPYVTALNVNTASYGSIAAGDSVAPAAPFVFSLASYFPSGHVVPFSLTVTDDASHVWTTAVSVTLSNSKYQFSSSVLTGAGNGILDPGEGAGLYFWLQNVGTRTSPANMTGYLRSSDPAVVITDSIGVFGSAGPTAQCRNSSNLWGISATLQAYPGERVPLTVTFPLANGFTDTVRTFLTIGSIASNAPTPADQYGYWAFDNTDAAYPRHPTYNWVEIDRRQGGSGTVIGLLDNADEQDATTVVDLPFTFRYYGQDYTQISVCSNGWLAMGASQAAYTDFRNYTIPSAMGPNAMIAPFWDDLRVAGQSSMTSHPEGRSSLDQGSPTCPGTIITSTPYADSGTTVNQGNDYSGSTCAVSNSADVFYQLTPDVTTTYTISLCGSNYDTGLMIRSGGPCPGITEVACNDDYGPCGTGSQIARTLGAGTTYYIIVDGYGTSQGNYVLNVTRLGNPDGVYVYHDQANHRFIIEWSGLSVSKWTGSNLEPESFECILYEPGYPPTQSGDGEILFQYQICANTTDVTSSNDYATVGIENLDQTDGVLYSYYNRVSPAIPGAAPMISGRAILFTTQKLPIDTPATPRNVTALRVGDDVRLLWNRVTTDVHGDPVPPMQYNVYRSSSVQFIPDGSTFVATVSDTSYLDVNPSAARAFYVVRAYAPNAAGAMGNASAVKRARRNE
ncbi:MAG TPA: C25 family cysteine peptidase [bacterium]|jgi:hypothetical protein